MHELPDILQRLIYPTNHTDVAVTCLLLCGSALVLLYRIKLVGHGWGALLTAILRLLCLGVLFFIGRTSVVPYICQFEEREFGVLLPRFEGADNHPAFGELRISGVLERELELAFTKLPWGETDEWRSAGVKLKTVSWKVGSEQAARELMEQYNASAILYGTVTSSIDALQLLTTLYAGPLVFVVRFSADIRESVVYEVGCGPGHYTIGLSSDRLGEVTEFAHEVVDCLLPALAASMTDSHTMLGARAILHLPQADQWYADADYAGFLLQKVADIYERSDSLEKAAFYYRLSYHYLDSLAHVAGWGKYDYEEDTVKIHRFMVFSRLREAHVCFLLGREDRLVQCALDATRLADSELRPIVDKCTRDWGWEFQVGNSLSRPDIRDSLGGDNAIPGN